MASNPLHEGQHDDYADTKSPTLAALNYPQSTSTTTVTGARRTDVEIMDKTDATEMLLPRNEPTLAMPINEVENISVPSVRHTTRQGGRTSTENTGEVIDLSQYEPLKRRRSDLGDLIVKNLAAANPISDKPAEQYSNDRPEITRLAESDSMSPPQRDIPF